MKKLKVEVIIFDVDGVLYEFWDRGKNNSIYLTPFYREIRRRGIKFISIKLGKNPKESEKIWEEIFKKYNGDVSIGLEKEFGIGRYDYFEYTWDLPPERYLISNSRVINFIKEIRLRKGILSNAPTVWVRNVLKFLSLENKFEWIHTGDGEIRKPDLGVYEPKYLRVAKKIGFVTALVGKLMTNLM